MKSSVEARENNKKNTGFYDDLINGELSFLVLLFSAMCCEIDTLANNGKSLIILGISSSDKSCHDNHKISLASSTDTMNK
ncbi:MAG: hypothetical protein WC606_05775 [Candidatus Absconditabacterales bacterium]